MKGIHKNLSLSVSTVSKLRLRTQLTLAAVSGCFQGKSKLQLFPEAQTVKPPGKCFLSHIHRRLGKINIIGMNQGIFQILHRIVRQGCNLIAAPAFILLPA